jgi:hypothetical protein
MSDIFPANEYKPGFGLDYPFFTEEVVRKMKEGEVKAALEAKAVAELNGKGDAVSFGWVLPSWREFQENWGKYKMHCILGGNRSGKSTLMARTVVDCALNIPEARIRCWHANDARSIEQQQQVWEALPDRFKNMGRKKGLAHSIQYSQKNGFTNGKLILPPMQGASRGSEIIFMNYAQYRNDSQVAEGWWAHLIWMDEEAPEKLVETMRPRLIDARGRLVLTFTTLHGWTPLVARILSRTKTLKTIQSKFLNRPMKTVPVLQESLSEGGCVVYYFQSDDNPFLPAGEIAIEMTGKPDEYILARAHGIPTRAGSSPFPGFDEAIHVIPKGNLPWDQKITMPDGRIITTEATHYHICDPSGSKPWFMLWIAVLPDDTAYVYREWPDVDTYGEWAEFGAGSNGKAGPGQNSIAFGFKDYRDTIKEIEGGTIIDERIMDSRLGNTPKQSAEGATCIISEMDDLDLMFKEAPGLMIDHGITLINDRLRYDEKRPLGAENHPRLYISDSCQNTIFALKNYTGVGGKDEATKDPIDCLRYAFEYDIAYMSKEDAISTRGMGSY